MPEQKPLHVQVAEAHGWTDCRPQEWEISGQSYINDSNWLGVAPYLNPLGQKQRLPIPHYDTDWLASGPLIEKYHINLEYPGNHWNAFTPQYAAFGEFFACRSADAPLIAVCHLILELAKAGKL